MKKHNWKLNQRQISGHFNNIRNGIGMVILMMEMVIIIYHKIRISQGRGHLPSGNQRLRLSDNLKHNIQQPPPTDKYTKRINKKKITCTRMK